MQSPVLNPVTVAFDDPAYLRVERRLRRYRAKGRPDSLPHVLLITLSLFARGNGSKPGGALLTRWLPLSLFQASGLAIGSTLAIAAVIHILAGITRPHQIYDPDGNFEDEDDDYDPIVPEPDFSKVGRNDYGPCGSGKKFKHGCEHITVK